MATIDPPRRKRIRLERDVYAVPGLVWHVTVDAANRRPNFANDQVASFVTSTLSERCRIAGADLLLYCLMPEHIHAIIAIGRDDQISILRAVKSLSGRWWKAQGHDGDLWQRSFYDRGIRNEEQMDAAIKYVLDNPIDEGLVSDWTDYPWIGGSLLDRP
jgi:putative transposase